MNLDIYTNVEIYREANGWQFASALDVQRNLPVAMYCSTVNSSVPLSTVQDYLRCLHRLCENPHPNLVAVLDAGIENDQIIVVGEWIDAQDLLECKDQGLSYDDLVSMCVALEKGLQHITSLGSVHRSISPESVLFEASSGSVRLDVPLWTLSEPTTPTLEGQEFDAPEVLSAQQYSAASDIYSVGILLYSILIGKVPWTDQNAAPRVRAPEDAVPRLPAELQSIQQEIDDMLAYDPTTRKLSYEKILDLSTFGDSPSKIDQDTRYRSGLIDSAEVRNIALPLEQAVGTPIESPSSRSRFWLYSTLSTIAIVGVLASVYAYTNFDGVRMVLYEIGLAEHPELSERWRQAESLRLDQNQSLITLMAAYNTVLELKPNHSGAQQAISDVKRERIEKIASLIQSDEFTLAQARLDEYVTAVPNDLEVPPLVTELANRQRRDRLLADTRPLVAAGIDDLSKLDAAVSAYKTVLRLFPDSEEARRHLNDIAVMFTEAAIDAANNAEIDRAWLFFDKAEEADPDVQALENVRGIVELAESLDTEINTTIQRATKYFEEGSLITPSGEDNAMYTFRQVLALDPGNEIAQTKLREIEQKLVDQHQELLEEREFSAHTQFVRAARDAGVSETTLQDMANALTNLQERIADAAKRHQEALSLFELGYIFAPESRNAVQVLMEAQELDAKNADVQALLDHCAERIATVAQEAFRAGLINQATAYMSVALEIQPLNDEWSTLYRQWAEVD